jgi:hypothetical protein
MDKRTETAFVLDSQGRHVGKHVFVWPGYGAYAPANDSWVASKETIEEPARIYSYAGGTVILPWKLEDGKWVPDAAVSIISGGSAADPKVIEGNPKETIRLIGHHGNAILVIGWPDCGEYTIYIFDLHGRQLTTGIHPWSLGSDPCFPFCTEISRPVLKEFPKGIELVISKHNKTKTSITMGLPNTKNSSENLPLLVFSI